MFRLLESIRIADGIIENLDAHQQRVERSCMELYHKTPSWSIRQLLQSESIPGSGLCKLRIVYDHERTEWSVTPYTIKPVRSLRMVSADEMVYHYKLADRSNLDEVFAQRGSKDDILIVKNGKVTDSSYANIVFSRDGNWYTPDTFLLNGTMRQLLIKQGRIQVAPIAASDLQHFDQFCLINAMLRMDAPPSDVSNIS